MKTLMFAALAAAALLVQGCAREGAVAGDGPTGDVLMIDDFNAGMKPNMLGGDFGAWDKDPEDFTQSAVASFDPDVKLGDEGFSMRIEYDVDSPNPAFNGFWMKLEGADFSEYENLHFSVKGDPEAGFTERFKVELKNTAGETGMYMLSGVTDEWQEMTLPLSSFRGLRDVSSMDEFVIVFEDTVANPKVGTIYVDNIYAK